MRKVSEYFKDFAVVTGLLTVLSYFLCYSFEKGRIDFYGIGDISFTEIGLSSTINTLQALSPLIFITGLIILFANFIFLIIGPIFSGITKLGMYIIYYVIFGPINFAYKFCSKKVPEEELPKESFEGLKSKLKKKWDYAVGEWNIAKKDILGAELTEDLKKKVSLIYTYAISVTISLVYIPKITLGITISEFPELWKFLGLILVFIPLVVTGGLVIFQKARAIQSGEETSVSQEQDDEVSSIPISLKVLSTWEGSKWLLKTIIVFLMVVIISEMFYQYGYTAAEQKKEYMTVKYNGATLVILEKGKDLLITAEIKEGDKYPKLNGEYKLIELKPNDKNKELVLKSEKFPKGIEILENERKKLFWKINFWLK
ncbi:hypothetical protein COD66_29690 [Bacillus cereus]|nr:hypothetical protein COD66_29690 [Bacillus cereus]